MHKRVDVLTHSRSIRVTTVRDVKAETFDRDGHISVPLRCGRKNVTKSSVSLQIRSLAFDLVREV